MTEIQCKTRKIGGSIGVILPKGVVEKEGIVAARTLKF